MLDESWTISINLLWLHLFTNNIISGFSAIGRTTMYYDSFALVNLLLITNKSTGMIVQTPNFHLIGLIPYSYKYIHITSKHC